MRRAGVAAGVAGVAGCALGLVVSPRDFFVSYLAGFLFVLGIPLGSLALLMLHHLVGGRWGFLVQRTLEAAVGTLPLFVLLFLPVLFGLRVLYPWSDAALAASDPVIAHKASWLSPLGFAVRAAVYFFVWLLLTALLLAESRRLDETGDTGAVVRLARIAGPGLVLFVLSATFAAIDWAMTLDPHWYSTIYGLIFAVSWVQAALAFATAKAMRLRNRPELAALGGIDQVHDLGKLLFGFVMLWGYVQFSQFLIIWSADVPEEIPWYAHRLEGVWGLVTPVVVLAHLVLPFVLLLGRFGKRRPGVLGGIAVALLASGALQTMWMVKPSADAPPTGLDLAVLLALGGPWLVLFERRLERRSLAPLADPRLVEAYGRR